MKTLSLRLGLVAAVACAVACGSSTSPDGGTDSGTSTTVDSGDMTVVDAGTKTYCDGFSATDSAGDEILVETYSFGGVLKTEGCRTAIYAYRDGAALTQLGGILDLDTDDSMPYGVALFPGNCADLGFTSDFTEPANSFTAPTGIGTVAAAVAAKASGASLFGVVTAAFQWSNGTLADGGTGGEAHGGTVYIQDPTASGAAPAANSGIEIYVPKAADGIMGSVAVGDVISITGLKWSPYMGANQFEAAATSVVTSLGTSPLPTPVMLTPADLGGATPATSLTGAAAAAEGMRVVVTGTFTVEQAGASATDCPATLQYTSTGG